MGISLQRRKSLSHHREINNVRNDSKNILKCTLQINKRPNLKFNCFIINLWNLGFTFLYIRVWLNKSIYNLKCTYTAIPKLLISKMLQSRLSKILSYCYRKSIYICIDISYIYIYIDSLCRNCVRSPSTSSTQRALV